MATYAEYRSAAALLWGPAGEFAADEFARLNREHFGGSMPPMPLIIGLIPYGVCIGATLQRPSWLDSPRITLPPELFNGNARTRGGPLMVSDVLVHEMVHAALVLRGEEPKHNAPPWARMVGELSPGVLGREVDARPVGTMRVPNPARAADPAAPKTVVVRRPAEGAITQAQLAAWPGSLRPEGYYAAGAPLPVPTY